MGTRPDDFDELNPPVTGYDPAIQPPPPAAPFGTTGDDPGAALRGPKAYRAAMRDSGSTAPAPDDAAEPAYLDTFQAEANEPSIEQLAPADDGYDTTATAGYDAMYGEDATRAAAYAPGATYAPTADYAAASAGGVVPGAADAPRGEPTERIVVDIEHTRAELSGTLGAIGQKLDPQLLMEQARETVTETANNVVEQVKETVSDTATHAVQQAKETVREATVGKVENMVQHASDTVGDVQQQAQQAGTTIVETVRQNPIPAAIAGLGLWMLWRKSSSAQGGQRVGFQSRGATGRYSQAAPYASSGPGQGAIGQAAGSAQQAVGSAVSMAQDAVGSAASTASDVAGNAASTAGDVVSNVASTAGSAVSTAASTAGQAAGTVASAAGDVAAQVRDTAGNLVSQVSETAGDVAGKATMGAADVASQLARHTRRARSRVQRALAENPLGVGAVAVAVGAAAGLALPTTRKEQELMGDARASVMERAAETVERTTSRAEEAVISAV